MGITLLIPLSLVWLRRDLRLEDNTALHHACQMSESVAVGFVYDTKILERLPSKHDRRLTFIHDTLSELNHTLKGEFGSQLFVAHGDPVEEIPKMFKSMGANALFFNDDYEPYAKRRDKRVKTEVHRLGTKVFSFKDQVILDGSEVSKSDGHPYQMFTPYKKAWLKKVNVNELSTRTLRQCFISQRRVAQLSSIPSLEDLGFVRTNPPTYSFQSAGRKAARKALLNFAKNIDRYHETRDYPCIENGTSGLSVHLRFGTLSIRECIKLSLPSRSLGAKTWLSELIWREFFQMILDRFPHVAKGSFKRPFDQISWPKKNPHFRTWCSGQTGFPLVDAGMRQLNETGWMHNRVRMVTASFLVKDLLVNWQKGEAYFAKKLYDFDLAANNGGWQWCASTGCDAQPYFRIFNPSLQSKKFDPEALYIKKWLPELKNCSPRKIHSPEISQLNEGANYPAPIVSHSKQRNYALKMYQAAR